MKKPLLLPDDANFIKNLRYSYSPAQDLANYCKENHNLFKGEFAAQIEKRLMRAFVFGFKEAKPAPKPEPQYIIETPKSWWEDKEVPEYFAYFEKSGMGTTTSISNPWARFSITAANKLGLAPFITGNTAKKV